MLSSALLKNYILLHASFNFLFKLHGIFNNHIFFSFLSAANLSFFFPVIISLSYCFHPHCLFTVFCCLISVFHVKLPCSVSVHIVNNYLSHYFSLPYPTFYSQFILFSFPSSAFTNLHFPFTTMHRISYAFTATFCCRTPPPSPSNLVLTEAANAVLSAAERLGLPHSTGAVVIFPYAFTLLLRALVLRGASCYCRKRI